MDVLTVTTKCGMLRGKRSYSNLHKIRYISFLGIPFAKPPISDLRFMPPVPTDGWSDVLDATKERPQCSQFNPHKMSYDGDEDCLYLNIHTTDMPSKVSKPKAVLVNVSLGSYAYGGGSMDEYGDPEFIISPDIIYVTFNYRVNVFGFLNFMVPECQGNAGLKDMVLAFRWIKENIREFGGDPDNITAIGNSAGAHAIHWMTCSPLSRGLFNKIILQGCHALANECVEENPLKVAFEFANAAGYSGENKHEAVKFLKSQRAILLLEAQKYLRIKKKADESRLQATMFLPSVEIDNETAFISVIPREFVKNMECMPVLYNVCNKEGGFIFSGNPWRSLNQDLKSIVKTVFFKFFEEDDEILTEITNRVREFHFKNIPVINEFNSFNDVIDLYTGMWNLGLYEGLENVLHKSPEVPVYLYEFAYDGNLNYCKRLYVRYSTTFEGACHSDEIGYWNYQMHFADIDENDRIVINRMCKFIRNFSKNGNPNDNGINVNWTPTTKENPCYLEFNNTLRMVHTELHPEITKFWRSIVHYILERQKIK